MTKTQLTVVNSRTKSIYLQENEDFLLEFRSINSQPTAVVRLCASLLNTSLNSQQLKASKPTSYLISIKSNISTEKQIRSAYLNLGSSWCPSKLTNPLIKYAILDDFETSTLKEVTTEAIAFCGRQCVLNLFTYQFSQPIAVNTNPYLCFAIKGKTKDTLNFTYNAFGLTSRLLKQTFTYTTDLTLPDENS
ncbi:Fibrocystin-L [Schistosoma japonicum]|nr:Fibrocystin-L [Schistosoma japonicum]